MAHSLYALPHFPPLAIAASTIGDVCLSLTLNSKEALLINLTSGVCLPGGLPGVLNGAINYARCVWVHYSKGRVPRLLLLLLRLGLI